MRFILSRFAVITFSIICLLQSTSAQWHQFRGPLRNGFCSETNLLKQWPDYGPNLAWSSDTVGAGFSSATIEDGIVYTTGKQDSLEVMTAFDFKGNLLWQQVFGRAISGEWPESRSTPTVYKGKVYAISVAGDLACLDSKTGEVNWQMPVIEKFSGLTNFNGFTESLIVLDDKVVVSPCGHKTTMVALNRLSGEVIWASESIGDTSRHTSPILIEENGQKLLITTTNYYVAAIDFNTGKLVWKKNDMFGIVPLPLQNKFYINGNDRQGGVMFNKNGDNEFTLLWQDTVHSNYMGGSVLIGDKLFFLRNDNNRGLVCLDANTGKVLSINKEINSGSLLATNDMLYCYEERRGRVCLLKLNETGAELVSSFIIKQGTGPHLAHLSIANGYLFVRHNRVLMAYDIKG